LWWYGSTGRKHGHLTGVCFRFTALVLGPFSVSFQFAYGLAGALRFGKGLVPAIEGKQGFKTFSFLVFRDEQFPVAAGSGLFLFYFE